jgi:hypothetical protein
MDFVGWEKLSILVMEIVPIFLEWDTHNSVSCVRDSKAFESMNLILLEFICLKWNRNFSVSFSNWTDSFSFKFGEIWWNFL